MSNTTNTRAISLVPGFVGQRCAGHILCRGKSGFEGYNASDQSLGTFSTQRAAAGAIQEQANGTAAI